MKSRTPRRPAGTPLAAKRQPSTIEPWHGPVRGFSFARDVQPVLDRYCVACHDGSSRDDGKVLADLRGDQDKFVVIKGGDPAPHVIAGAAMEDLFKQYGGVFQPSYFELRRFVRVGGFESDIRLLAPGEFQAWRRRSWCRCSAKGTTASNSTPTPGTGWPPGSI